MSNCDNDKDEPEGPIIITFIDVIPEVSAPVPSEQQHTGGIKHTKQCIQGWKKTIQLECNYLCEEGSNFPPTDAFKEKMWISLVGKDKFHRHNIKADAVFGEDVSREMPNRRLRLRWEEWLDVT